jgi:alpha-tubulin suppressor-like RCC1 family protein
MYSAGDAHSAALTSNGFLFMWGSNEKGQLGLPAAADVAAQASVRPLPLTLLTLSNATVFALVA